MGEQYGNGMITGFSHWAHTNYLHQGCIWTLEMLLQQKTLGMFHVIILNKQINKAQPSINLINRKRKFTISFKSFKLEIEIQSLLYKYFRPNEPIITKS